VSVIGLVAVGTVYKELNLIELIESTPSNPILIFSPHPIYD
jgi:hypothetical protein